MPSIMEGMPLAVVEAMLCGRTVMATHVGGHKEWITHNINGFIADEPTVESISEAMEMTWSKKNNWESMGKAAHEKALELYDPNSGNTYLHSLMKWAHQS